MMTFVQELRRRNVIRLAATYSLIAWIIIEAGSVLLPTFGAPEGAFRIYVIAVVAGFTLALVMAWVFEITPDGVKLERDLDPAQRRASPQTRQRMNVVIIGLLVLALTVSITFNVTGIRDTESSPTVESTGNWIAVLPFTEIGDGGDNNSLVDGIHNDLLTTLASNKSLKVISQTSVMKYRGKEFNIRQIGAELNVDTILEGTIQRVGNNVRINMQLIDARTDEHLWAEVYDRNLTMQNIFAIQSDISSAIARELSAALTPDNQRHMPRIPTENLVAFNLYSKATSEMALRQLPNALTAREQFEQAIALDPNFAEAHAGLAMSVLLLYINDRAVEKDEAFDVAERELDIALTLNPDLADAYAARGLMKMQQWEETRTGTENIEAATAFNRALDLNPNHAYAYMWFASLRYSEGQNQQAIELYEKSKEVDPLGRIPYANLPGLYAEMGQTDVALKLLVQATQLHPDWPMPYKLIAMQLAALSRIDESLAWAHLVAELPGKKNEGNNLDVGIYMSFHDYDRAKQLINDVSAEHPLADFSEGLTMLIDRDADGAMKSLLAVIENDPQQPKYMYGILSSVALLAGDLDTAEDFTLRGNPILTSDADLVVDKHTLGSVLQLAYIAAERDDTKAAHKLLTDALTYVQSLPRLGSGGHGIADVQIYAMLGRVDDAIAALQDAVAEGFRSSAMFNFWPIDEDPYLASLNSDERFVALLDTINADVERMRENTVKAEKTGDWSLLRNIVIQAANTDIVAGLQPAITR